MCSDCGHLKRIHHHRGGGAAVCGPCYSKSGPIEPCARCGRMALPIARCDDGPRCDRCWEYERTGGRCGCAAPVLVDAACILCAAGRAGRGAIADPVRAWLVAQRGTYARQWLRATAGGRILQAMLRGDIAATHEALDASRPAPAVATLRARLVALGVLAPRDDRVVTVQLAVTRVVQQAHPEDAILLAQFGRWVVLRGMLVRIDAETARTGTERTAICKIHHAAVLLGDLRCDQVSLAAMTQPWLDAWVALHRSARSNLRAFLAWARDQHLVTVPLDVEPGHSANLRLELHEDERSGMLSRLIHDEIIDARDRVAGFLLVALGQPLTRIVALSVDDVSTDTATRLRLGTRPLRIEPPFDHLLHKLVADASARRVRWLYPGRVGHLSAGRLAERLAAHGISSRLSARNSAWAALAAETPSIVLAEKLGISVSAAEGWSDAVATARNEYVGLLGDP